MMTVIVNNIMDMLGTWATLICHLSNQIQMSQAFTVTVAPVNRKQAAEWEIKPGRINNKCNIEIELLHKI